MMACASVQSRDCQMSTHVISFQDEEEYSKAIMAFLDVPFNRVALPGMRMVVSRDHIVALQRAAIKYTDLTKVVANGTEAVQPLSAQFVCAVMDSPEYRQLVGGVALYDIRAHRSGILGWRSSVCRHSPGFEEHGVHARGSVRRRHCPVSIPRYRRSRPQESAGYSGSQYAR